MPVMGTPEGLGIKSVTVKLKDGREYNKEVAISKGMPQNPLSPEEFKAKYRDCAATVLSKEAVEKSLSLLASLEKVGLSGTNPVESLMQILAPASPEFAW